MKHNIDHATYFKREVLIRIAKAFFDGTLEREAYKIPFEIRPETEDALRCCIHKERAVARLRCIAALGFPAEQDDEMTPLSEYATRALEREELATSSMTVLDIACKACVKSKFFVTDVCRSCLARPCATHCHFDAIDFKAGKAEINPEKCRNCGKCITVCPFQAIIKLRVPCEDSCPVGAINKSTNGIAEIDFDKCTSCGRCMHACPFGAVMEQSQIVDVLKALTNLKDKKVVALFAPAIIGQFPADLSQLMNAVKKLGFLDVIEVAQGADVTIQKEAEEFTHKMANGSPFMTTSCCPAYVETVKRHIPELLPFVSQTGTPMHYAAQIAKEKYPDCTTVFIGPCVAKRQEGLHDEFVDYVLTFEELGALLVAKGIEVIECEKTALDYEPSKEGRGFPITMGVANAVSTLVKDIEVKATCINGLSHDAVKQLKSFAKNPPPFNLIEVMTCEGGCVAGPGTIANCKTAAREIKKLLGESKNIGTIIEDDKNKK